MAFYVLGVSAFYHDSAAALLADGEIVAAAQEERFTRIKGDPRFPNQSINFCLGQAGIERGDVDAVVFYEDPEEKADRLLATFDAFGARAWRSFQRALPRMAAQHLDAEQRLRAFMGVQFKGDVLFSDHHESHAASAFFPSPFEDAAILTMDAVGEWATTSIAMGSGNRIQMMKQIRFPHSLGMLYSAFTEYTGFKVNSGEYKMMGLAPYGKPRYAQLIKDELLHLHADGAFELNMEFFQYCEGSTMTSVRFHELFGGPPRSPESDISERERDLAASIQVVTEEVVLRTARYAAELSGCPNLVLAGGVALNCVANGRLVREGGFNGIWIQPAAGDSGGALGAAYIGWHQMMDKPRVVQKPDAQQASYLGPSYRNDDIQVFLDAAGVSYQMKENESELLDCVSDELAAGSVVGWFCGRMEYGPRALGARSIIGDARNSEMQSTMNLKIKYRESFRPFAPCVLREHVGEYFEGCSESPYMLQVAPLKAKYRTVLTEDQQHQLQDDDLCARASVPISQFPAITHVDYSARVQTVDEQRHGRYYRLIKAFYEKTGCPIIVNTSFNVRSEPIVCTPEDALNCFLATEMDCLVLENCVIWRSENAQLLVDGEEYRSKYALD